MDLRRNTFKTALLAHEAQIGFWLALADPYAAEVCAQAGFDWMLIDGEHAPNDVRSILAQLQALAAYPVEPVVRATVGDAALIKQLLDLGARSLLVPMVESAEQAEAIVRATRYPPHGVRGVGSALARAARWNQLPGYLRGADEEVCLLLQVESARGLDNLAAISHVQGVDGVFIGPADLAASLGHLGEPGHPEVQAAIEAAIVKIRAVGKAAGTIAVDATLARRYLALGASFVGVGSDVGVLTRVTGELAAAFKGAQAAPRGPSVY